MGEILPGVHIVEGVGTPARPGTVNVSLLVDNGVGTLIDAGYVGSGKQIERYLDRIGLPATSIRRVIVTHHHQDHTGGLSEVVALTNAEVWAHAEDAEFIDGSVSRPAPPAAVLALVDDGTQRRPPAPRAVPVELRLVGGEDLGVLGGCRILHTPGHTPGHLSLLLPELSLLIAGDMLRYADGAVTRAPEMFTWDLDEAEGSIESMAAFEFDHMLPYHGEYLASGASEATRRDLGL